MPIIIFDNISLDFSQKPLLDEVQLQIDAKERICLVGRNGTGKSCLLKLIADEMQADSGTIWRQSGLKIAKLNQDLPAKSEQKVFDYVATGLASLHKLIQEYHELLAELANSNDPAASQQDSLIKDDSNSRKSTDPLLARLEFLQKQIDNQDGWQFEQKINTSLTTLGLKADSLMSELSGGWRRRVALARALVNEPDLLLLDEPTNHLDLESIIWLEKHLLKFNGTIVCISHDRKLIDNIATRILELDRGKLYSIAGNFQQFNKAKSKRLEDEVKQNKLFNQKLAAEEVWIRQGIKARRTRNEGRVRALATLRKERQQRRDLLEKPAFNLKESDYSGKLVLEANKISHSYALAANSTPIINNFSLKIFRGDRIGILGPNGCGKSTLLKILLEKLSPQKGSIRLGTNLQIAYLDQLREQIDLNLSVADNVAQGRSMITLGDSSKHIISYLADFLFSPERAQTPVRNLSGGECNRLLLAKLFSMPVNFLVLDEPTNDLDIETLELLEDILLNFKGTILLVSHDRDFMDNVVTQVLAFEEQGKIVEYVGSYSDWLQQQEHKQQKRLQLQKQKKSADSKSSISTIKDSKATKENAATSDKTDKDKNLNYQARKELAAIPKKIEKLETKIQELHQIMAAPDFYNNSNLEHEKIMQQLKASEAELEDLYKRWEELEA